MTHKPISNTHIITHSPLANLKSPIAKHLAKGLILTGMLTGLLNLGACQSAQASITDIDLSDPKAEIAMNRAQTIRVSVEQDSNEITQAKINIDGQDYEMSFTAQELSSPDLLTQRLDILPATVRESVLSALKYHEPSVDNDESEHLANHRLDTGAMSFIKLKALDKKDQAKLAELHRTLAQKQQAIEKHAQSININTRDIDALAEEMEQLSKQLADKMAQIAPSQPDVNTAEIESITAKLNEKGREIERLMGGKHREVEMEIHSMSDGIEAIVEQIVELETQGRKFDGEHRVIVIKQDGEETTQGITKLIKSVQLTDEQKQQIKAALN